MDGASDERLLRAFVDDNAEALQQAGIDPTGFSTRIFRRTTATIIDAAAAITLASRLLGHANEQVTRSNDLVTGETVDPVWRTHVTSVTRPEDWSWA